MCYADSNTIHITNITFGFRPPQCTAPDLIIPKCVLEMWVLITRTTTVYTPYYYRIYTILLLYIRHTITSIRPAPMLRHKILKQRLIIIPCIHRSKYTKMPYSMGGKYVCSPVVARVV